MDFGEVEVGDVATLALSVSNEGGGLLTGTVLVEGGDGAFTASASEFERSSGTSGALQIAFRPTAVGIREARLVFRMNGAEPLMTVTLKGVGVTTCGNGTLDDGERCDDSVNDGAYGGCRADCSGGAGSCGDGVVNGPETCDDGVNDGAYGGCLAGCSGRGDHCGDGVVNGSEACDDGLNDGEYGHCLSGCVGVGASCGDGRVSGPESCDPASEGAYCCNSDCTFSDPCAVELLVTADDAFEAWIDGTFVGRGVNWGAAFSFLVALSSGPHVVAVRAEDYSVVDSTFRALVTKGGRPFHPTGGPDWRVSPDDPGPGWELAGFDDSSWATPQPCERQFSGAGYGLLAQAAWVWDAAGCDSRDPLDANWYRLRFNLP